MGALNAGSSRSTSTRLSKLATVGEHELVGRLPAIVHAGDLGRLRCGHANVLRQVGRTGGLGPAHQGITLREHDGGLEFEQFA